MERNIMIDVKNISKSFKSKRRNVKKSSDAEFKKIRQRKILDDVSFSVEQGSSLGIIGKNGAGKSTIAKILAGVMSPDSGEIYKGGRVASLLELGIGFHLELTGRENIYIKGSTFGLSKKDIGRRIEKIIEFSELDDYIDEPMRIYSSGMNARLAFAIAINVDADIIIADEIFSVGDLSFREKCANVFRSMRKNGATLVIVSHSLSVILEMCDIAIWLRDGKIYDSGDCKNVCDHYEYEVGNSLKSLQKDVEGGNDNAQNKLAILYRDGKNIEIDYDKALHLFKLSAEQGNREAQRNLGDMISKGLGTIQNQSEALKWFLKAAENGDQQGMEKVANMYKDGIGIVADQQKASLWFRELAERGNSRAQFALAKILLDDERGREEALNWFIKSSDLGNKMASHNIGMMYKDGNGVDKDIREAVKWFVKAAQQDNVESQTILWQIHNSSEFDEDLNEELKDVIKHWSSSAEKGNAFAQRNFAWKLLLGVELEQNASTAFELFLRAAEAGDSSARLQIGIMYKDGIGTDINIVEALKWLECSAEQKNYVAIGTMARMFLNGEGVEKNQKKAFILYKEVADSGNSFARNQVGMMYKNGIGTEKDIDLAKKYLKLSAEQGNNYARINLANILFESEEQSDKEYAFSLYLKVAYFDHPFACHRVGMMYKEGIGVNQNTTEADKWLKKMVKGHDEQTDSELTTSSNEGIDDL